MSSYQNENLAETVKQKIKLFTKESYFKYFNYILIEKSKNISAFQKISSLSFSIEKEFKEKSKKNKIKLKGKENSEHSIWYIIMLLICDNTNHNKKYYKRNEFNLNPICYSYLTNLCQKKIKLLISFSINHRLTLGTLVKYYLDLCINQMNQKDMNDELQTNNILSRPSAILDYRKFNKKTNQKVILKESNNNNSNNKNIDNSNEIDNNKKSNQKKKLEYCNSFTRLFIGEIDANSVRERYLSNMVIKKRKELHLYNSYTDLSNMYLKRLYNKLFKKENKKVMDRDMMQVLNQFKNDTKKVESYQRNILILEKFEKNRENNNNEFDEVKELLKNELKAQKKIYMEHGINDNEKNNNCNHFKRRKYYPRFLSLSPSPKSNNFYKINSHIFYKNNDNNNNDNKSQCLSSFNLSSNNNNNTKRMRCVSASVKKSRHDLKKEIASKIGILCSTINIKEKNQNHTNNNISQKEKIFTLMKDKKNYNLNKNNQIHINRSNSILIKMKNELKENNDIIRKRRQYKLKNYLNKNDFFYTKMN